MGGRPHGSSHLPKLPASRLQAAPACLRQLWGAAKSQGRSRGRRPGRVGTLSHSESRDTCDPPPGRAPGWVELACSAGHPPAQDSFAFTAWLVGRERGQSPTTRPPLGVGEHSLAASYAAGEKNPTGTLDRIDLLRIWEDVSSLKDFFLKHCLAGLGFLLS